VRTEVAAFFCAAFVCSALVPVIIRFARRHGLYDHISSTRKVHSARVPGSATVPCFASLALASSSERLGGADACVSAGAGKP